MDITDAKEDRLRLGVDRFLAGDSVEYHGVKFFWANEATLQIDSYTEWEPERTSEAHARELLTRSKAVFAELTSRSRRTASPPLNSSVRAQMEVCCARMVTRSAQSAVIVGSLIMLSWLAARSAGLTVRSRRTATPPLNSSVRPL